MGLKFIKGGNGNWYLTNDSSPKLFDYRMYFNLKCKPSLPEYEKPVIVKESVKLLSVRKESDVELQQSPGNQSGN